MKYRHRTHFTRRDRHVMVPRNLAENPVSEGLENRPGRQALPAVPVTRSLLPHFQAALDESHRVRDKAEAALSFFRVCPPPSPAWIHWVEDRVAEARYQETRAQTEIDRIMQDSDHTPGTEAAPVSLFSQSMKPVAVMSHNPPSWFTARGALAKRRMMERRGLPSFRGWLFVTFTVNRNPFDGGIDCPETAYLEGKEKLWRTIWRLRNDFGYEIENATAGSLSFISPTPKAGFSRIGTFS